MRIAILGAARIAARALIEPARAYAGPHARPQVHAIGASSPARARAFAAEHGIPVAGSYADVIARDDVDLVYIALPPSAHAHWTVEALKAGKHVMVEKPSALDAGEARAMVAAATAAGRRLVEAFHYAWHPLFLRAQEMVHGGMLGAVHRIEAAFEADIPVMPDEFRWRPDLGGGALADLGCYPVSWVRGLVEDEPQVSGAAQRLAQGVDVGTTAGLVLAGGGTAAISCSMDHPGPRAIWLTVAGSAGTLRIQNPLAPQFGHRFVLERPDGTVHEERFAQRPTFEYQFDGILDAILTGAPMRPEGDEIIANIALMDAIRAAATRTTTDPAP